MPHWIAHTTGKRPVDRRALCWVANPFGDTLFGEAGRFDWTLTQDAPEAVISRYCVLSRERYLPATACEHTGEARHQWPAL